MSEFAPDTVERADLWQLVASRLRYAIVSRELKPGEHLRELPLARRFGVSRVPVREALIRLSHEGLIQNEPRRGAFVVGMTLDDIRELYEVRAVLEVRGAQLAAKAAVPENITNLRRIIKQFDEAAKIGDSESIAAVDIAFHREVMIAAHHRRLLATWEPLSGIIQTLLTLTNEQSNKTQIMSAHRPLVTAIAAGKADAAEKATLKSLAEGMKNAELMWST
ncbi:GntR family transcriptional regulator [Tenggerimyces flavus]|uniref:GntR family transcriptional regulator n=1 Tax=Tenggerimyces flavus TaxID=1708749 RepID=A0ABV7YK83_9ACTN|nr:GntR family transcriptional regulator [Tenggerimyces flavus]MBM7789607.1 GntR family transcriptional regulator of gluconate operon [Tenggerimyces flavus]